MLQMLIILSALIFPSCTYSITMVHTEGAASDIVDETATNSPSTDISPTFPLPKIDL